MALIEATNLGKTYTDEEVQTPALKEVNLKIEEGEFVAITGPSGSGKSTLLHLLSFLDRPTSGQYFFNGKSVYDYSDEALAKIRNKQMGFVFQGFNLLPRTLVIENVKLPLVYSDAKESLWKEMAEKAIESVGISHRSNYDPSKLSGGERQRVAIARALVNSPAVIFADEPTGNLDSKSGGQIMETLEKLNVAGHTIILVTHETYTAEYAERIIRIKDGRIESDEKVQERRRAKDQFIK